MASGHNTNMNSYSHTGVAAARQVRSRRTLERLLDVAEDLLEKAAFDSVPVSEIAGKAGVSVGNFYNRFPNKQALLLCLYDRYEQERTHLLLEAFSSPRWAKGDLSRNTRELARLFVEFFASRPGLIRAFVLHYRSNPEAFALPKRARLLQVYKRAAEILLTHRREIRHADPTSAARFAIFMTTAVCREKIVFASDPLQVTLGLSQKTLARELGRVLHSYLSIGV